MWINTFDVQDSETRKVGEALLFDNALLIVEWTQLSNDGTPNITMKSGGQDGMTNWLAKNNLQLFWKAISKTEVPTADQKMKLRMAMDVKLSSMDLDDGRSLKVDLVMPWAINEKGHKTMTTKVGSLLPKETNRTYVVVVDGSIAAFMPMEAFKDPHYGITDYEGGGHNFWIPFMMSGGRTGTGYIMTAEVPQLQANILLKALKNQTKDKKMEEILAYVLNNALMSPLPEFQSRLEWMAQKSQEILDEQGVDAEVANAGMHQQLARAIKSKQPEVFDNSFTLDGSYVVKGKEYEWPKP
tara:strand:+ start:6523 stop:7416 length:894 start_codon:yes stop_codon:yes gene_type:complete